MRFRNFLFVGAIVMLLPNTVFAAVPALDEEVDGKKPTLLALVPAPTPVRSIEELEGEMTQVLVQLSMSYLTMLGVAPEDPTIPTDKLLNSLTAASVTAAQAGSELGVVVAKCFKYYLRSLAGSAVDLSGLVAELREKAVAGNKIASAYLRNIGQLEEEAATAAVVEETEAYKTALKIIASDGDWASKSDEARLEQAMKEAETDPKVWDLIVEALKPVDLENPEAVKRTLGLASKQPDERLGLLGQIMNAENQSARQLYIEALRGDFNGAGFNTLTTHFGLLDLPDCFVADTVSLTQTVQIVGFDRPVNPHFIISQRLKGMCEQALNGHAGAQAMILEPHTSSSQNLVQWWLEKRKAMELRIESEKCDLAASRYVELSSIVRRIEDLELSGIMTSIDNSIRERIAALKPERVERVTKQYAEVEACQLSFWGFVFPVTRVM